MKLFNFSALKLMTSLCLLLFVSLAATRLQAQDPAKHTTTFALWEVENGNQKFALWNKYSKEYLQFASREEMAMVPTAKFLQDMEKISGGAYQVEYDTPWEDELSLKCCDGSDDNAYIQRAADSKDDLIFEEVSKDVFRIKFRHNGAYLTVGGQGSKEIYGTTIKMGDHQLWMITGR